MNTVNEEYKLPGDKREMERLFLQHRMWRLLVGGLYPSPPGSSHWSRSPSQCRFAISTEFQASRVCKISWCCNRWIGRFIRMDITQELPKIEGGYDIIHVRRVAGHLKEPAAFVERIYQALKPGGVLLLGDVCKIAGIDEKEVPPLFPNIQYSEDALNSGSWFGGWHSLWFKISSNHAHAVEDLLRGHGGFLSVCQKRYFGPINWSGESHDSEELGRIVQEITLGFCRAGIPAVLASAEFSATEIEEWMRSVEMEFDSESKREYIPWDLAYGVKSADF